MEWDWRGDLEVNAGRRDAFGALVALVMTPSFCVICWIRVMLALQQRNTRASRFFARLIAAHLVRTYALHVSVLVSRIGKGLKLPHPTGIVIGDRTVIGNSVSILQNVTLGRRSLAESGTPIIGDGVSIMAGAVVLGGVDIGDNAIIGANAVVLTNVPARTTVVGVPAKPIRVREQE